MSTLASRAEEQASSPLFCIIYPKEPTDDANEQPRLKSPAECSTAELLTAPFHSHSTPKYVAAAQAEYLARRQRFASSNTASTAPEREDVRAQPRFDAKLWDFDALKLAGGLHGFIKSPGRELGSYFRSEQFSAQVEPRRRIKLWDEPEGQLKAAEETAEEIEGRISPTGEQRASNSPDRGRRDNRDGSSRLSAPSPPPSLPRRPSPSQPTTRDNNDRSRQFAYPLCDTPPHRRRSLSPPSRRHSPPQDTRWAPDTRWATNPNTRWAPPVPNYELNQLFNSARDSSSVNGPKWGSWR